MTVGVLLGGRLGYVLFYEPRYFLTHPLEILAVWNGGMSFHGALLGSIVAIVLFARRVGADLWSVMDLARRGDADGPVLRAARQLHQRRAVGPAEHGALGDGVPGRRAACRAIRASSTRQSLEGLVLFAVLWWLTHRMAGAAPAGHDRPAPSWSATAWRARSANSSASPTPGTCSPSGPFTAGIFYSLPMILAGIS